MTDNPIQNFGLTYAAFNNMLHALQKGNETLFEHVFIKHFNDCRGYLIRECTANTEDAYDITIDTIIQFRKRLIEGKIEYGNLRYYFTKMAKDSLLKLFEKNKRLPVKELLLAEADREEENTQDFDEEQLQSLSLAWTKLNAECQELLRNNVYEGIKLRQIALSSNENEANIRKRKERCMDKLKSLFFKVYHI